MGIGWYRLFIRKADTNDMLNFNFSHIVDLYIRQLYNNTRSCAVECKLIASYRKYGFREIASVSGAQGEFWFTKIRMMVNPTLKENYIDAYFNNQTINTISASCINACDMTAYGEFRAFGLAIVDESPDGEELMCSLDLTKDV